MGHNKHFLLISFLTKQITLSKLIKFIYFISLLLVRLRKNLEEKFAIYSINYFQEVYKKIFFFMFIFIFILLRAININMLYATF